MTTNTTSNLIIINSEVFMTSNLYFITNYKNRGFYVTHKYNTNIQKSFKSLQQAVDFTNKKRKVKFAVTSLASMEKVGA